MLALLAFSALAVPQEPPPEGKVVTGRDRSSAILIQLSGDFDIHYMSRDGALNEAGRTLNGIPGEQPSTNLWAGRMSLRTDVTVKDSVSGVLEIENRSFDRGINHPFSSSTDLPTILIDQAYIHVPDFMIRGFDLRIGIQDLTLRNRPQDEPFFMDLGESESFWAGFTPATGHVRNTVDRDLHQATGVKASYAPNDFMGVEAAAFVYGVNGSTSQDESVYLIAANTLLAEHWAAWILGVVVTGGGPHLREVGTVGAGVDGYLGGSRALELFGEAYVQTGTLTDTPRTVRKEAYAFNAGARYLGLVFERLWIEGAISERSGDRSVSGRKDQAFQSYENENRFLILQSAEFGLDVDTNVRVLRGAAGYGPIVVDGRPLRFQLDVGRFSSMVPLFDGTGARFAGSQRQWGVETDLTASWSYNESLSFNVQAGWLADSELLQALTTRGERHSFLAVAGANLRF
jgi:hypothetical protein